MFGLSNIRGAQSLRRLNIEGVTALSLSFSPHHAYPLNTGAGIIESEHHPRHTQSSRKYNLRRDPLWWNCIVSNKVGGKKVVRTWLSNRTNAAITEALQRRGYAKDGTRFTADGLEDHIVGTATFFPLPELLHTSWEDLNTQSDILVKTLEKKLKTTPKSVFRRTVAGSDRSRQPLKGS